jgi:LAS superfamily LD-carboxypeptidase LdcB
MRSICLFILLSSGFLSFGVSLSYGAISPSFSGEVRSDTPQKKKNLRVRVPFVFSQIHLGLYKKDPTWDDASITRFVTKTISLSDRSYAPDDLVSMSGAHIDQAGRSSELRREAHTALLDMAAAFDREFDRPIVVVSGYRSAAYQQRLWDLGRCTDTLCAPPGYSEHQL